MPLLPVFVTGGILSRGHRFVFLVQVKTLSGDMNLVQAKKFVESVPAVFRGDLNAEEAEKLKAALEAAGATVVVE